MRIAIVHYHLGLGGVTRVIESASQALTRAGIEHCILTGGSRDDEQSVSLRNVCRHVDGLGYQGGSGDQTAERLIDSLRRAATDALGAPPDIWHFHNHSLGKNLLIAEVIDRLAAANERLLLQIHDLAEDGRPANYALIADVRKLYPIGDRVHYAFLNSRDRKIFVDAGLPTQQASILPNSIAACSAVSPPPSPLLFAPIRGIRRKNIGELVCLSALAQLGTRFAISRAPSNPAARPIHDAWQKFAGLHQLPIEFDVVDRVAPTADAASDFDSWRTHATHFVSTSVAEGFGLPWLEAIARGRPLIGRNLAHLTADHARHGIHAGHLYDRLLIPADWIDLSWLRESLESAIERTYRSYRLTLSKNIIDAAFASLIHDGGLDFGNLPESFQQRVIEKCLIAGHRELLRVQIGDDTQSAVSWLAEVIALRIPTAMPSQLPPYSPSEYQKNLLALYSRLADQAAGDNGHLSASRILTAYLSPESFHFLLADPPVEKCRAVIFDIYGTLLLAAAGGVKSDPAADPLLREILLRFGHPAPASPSGELYAAVMRHHAAAGVAFPEIDLRVLWREVLSLDAGVDLTALVEAIEREWHPAQLMPGAESMIRALADTGIAMGLLSNAQCNTLGSLGAVADLFDPELSILSYQHGMAKPAPALFQLLSDRLAARGISPAETLFIGNDPMQDIVPAAEAGFKTALFIGHPTSLRHGDCAPDQTIRHWADLHV